MTKLRWTKQTTFTDPKRSFRARGGRVYEVDDEQAEEYLDHHSGGWEEANDADDAEVQNSSRGVLSQPRQTDNETGDDDTEELSLDPDVVESDDEAADPQSDNFDMDSFMSQGYRDRVDMVESGEVDDHLDEIEDEESSSTVRSAIDERRDELNE